MFRYISFFVLSFLCFQVHAENIFFHVEKFDDNDLFIINKFCSNYKSDLLKNLDLVTTENVSKETFEQFGILIQKTLKPGTLDFFRSLKQMGAEDCSF